MEELHICSFSISWDGLQNATLVARADEECEMIDAIDLCENSVAHSFTFLLMTGHWYLPQRTR